MIEVELKLLSSSGTYLKNSEVPALPNKGDILTDGLMSCLVDRNEFVLCKISSGTLVLIHLSCVMIDSLPAKYKDEHDYLDALGWVRQ